MRALTRCDLLILVVKIIIFLFVWTWLLFSPLIFKFEISTYSQQSNKSHNFNSLSSLYLIEKVLFLDEFFFLHFWKYKNLFKPIFENINLKYVHLKSFQDLIWWLFNKGSNFMINLCFKSYKWNSKLLSFFWWFWTSHFIYLLWAIKTITIRC